MYVAVKAFSWVLAGLLLLSVKSFAVAPDLRLFPKLMDTLMAGDYPSAALICEQIEFEQPSGPAAPYARACLIYAYVTDLEDTLGRSRFYELCDSTIALCGEIGNTPVSGRAAAAFLRGSALAAKALMMNREGAPVKALRHLMRARGAFQDAIDADPRFYDAYLGRGAYRYGVATHASLISWLPFIPSAESGWKDMWLAADSSRFSRFYALSALVWFVLEKRDYTLADSICQVGLTRFPGCRSFLWPQLALHQRQGHWDQAERVSLELLSQYLAHPDNNGYDATGLYAGLMICADSLNRPGDAIEYARRGLATYRKPDVIQKRKDKLELMEGRLAQTEQRGND